MNRQTPATITVKGKPHPDYAIGCEWEEDRQRWIFGVVYGQGYWTQMRYGSDYFDPHELIDPNGRYQNDPNGKTQFALDMGNEIEISVEEFARALKELGLIWRQYCHCGKEVYWHPVDPGEESYTHGFCLDCFNQKCQDKKCKQRLSEFYKGYV